jgi:hypothetical protein
MELENVGSNNGLINSTNTPQIVSE